MIEENILKGFNEPRVGFPWWNTCREAGSLTPSCRGGLLSDKPEAPLPTDPKEQTLNKQLKATRAARAPQRGNGTVSPPSADKTAQALAASPPAGTPSPEEQSEKL